MAEKYNSARDELLHRMSQDGWGNQSGGDAKAPTGRFCLITVSDRELKEVADAFEEEAAAIGAQVPVGNFILVEAADGAITVSELATEAAATARYGELVAAYGQWASA